MGLCPFVLKNMRLGKNNFCLLWVLDSTLFVVFIFNFKKSASQPFALNNDQCPDGILETMLTIDWKISVLNMEQSIL